MRFIGDDINALEMMQVIRLLGLRSKLKVEVYNSLKAYGT